MITSVENHRAVVNYSNILGVSYSVRVASLECGHTIAVGDAREKPSTDSEPKLQYCLYCVAAEKLAVANAIGEEIKQILADPVTSPWLRKVLSSALAISTFDGMYNSDYLSDLLSRRHQAEATWVDAEEIAREVKLAIVDPENIPWLREAVEGALAIPTLDAMKTAAKLHDILNRRFEARADDADAEFDDLAG